MTTVTDDMIGATAQAMEAEESPAHDYAAAERARQVEAQSTLTDNGRVEKAATKQFFYVAALDRFICTTDMGDYNAAGVNALCGDQIVTVKGVPKKVKAATVIIQASTVNNRGWFADRGIYVEGEFWSDGEWQAHPSYSYVNLYRPPHRKTGDPKSKMVKTWRSHVNMLVGDAVGEAALLSWMAARVQKPWVKPQWHPVIGGEEGIGKDLLLYPLLLGVGGHNYTTISATRAADKFTDWCRNVLVVVSELRDYKNKHELFNDMKEKMVTNGTGSIGIRELHLKEYPVPNVLGFVFTTNHQDALALDDNTRRLLCIWSPLRQGWLTPDQFEKFWDRLKVTGSTGGQGSWDIIAFLEQYPVELGRLQGNAPRTAAFADYHTAGLTDLAQSVLAAVDRLQRPLALTTEDLRQQPELVAYTTAMGGLVGGVNAKALAAILKKHAGYEKAVHPTGSAGRWAHGSDYRNVFTPKGTSFAAVSQAVAARAPASMGQGTVGIGWQPI